MALYVLAGLLIAAGFAGLGLVVPLWVAVALTACMAIGAYIGVHAGLRLDKGPNKIGFLLAGEMVVAAAALWTAYALG